MITIIISDDETLPAGIPTIPTMPPIPSPPGSAAPGARRRSEPDDRGHTLDPVDPSPPNPWEAYNDLADELDTALSRAGAGPGVYERSADLVARVGYLGDRAADLAADLYRANERLEHIRLELEAWRNEGDDDVVVERRFRAIEELCIIVGTST